MNLKEKLMQDFVAAMKAKDEIGKNTINFARAAIKQYEVDNRQEATDELCALILAKQVKMRRDALSDFEKAGRTDLKEAYEKEIEILTSYLPKQLTAEELKTIARETMAELGIEGGRQNMGKIMGPVMAKVKGRADGNEVKKVIEDLL